MERGLESVRQVLIGYQSLRLVGWELIAEQ